MYADSLETAAQWGLPMYTMESLRMQVRERVNRHLYPVGLEVTKDAEILNEWVLQTYEHLFVEKTYIVIIHPEIAQKLPLKYRDSVDYNRYAKDIEVGDTLYSGLKVTDIGTGIGAHSYVTINRAMYHATEVLEIV